MNSQSQVARRRLPTQRAKRLGGEPASVTSAVLHRHRAYVVHLAEVDAVMAEDRVRHRRMEEEVRYRDVYQIIVAVHPLPAQPRWSHLAFPGSDEVLRLDG